MKLLDLEKRKPLTDLGRIKMFRDHKGICCICKKPIDGVREKWIDEHQRALAMGGSNDPSNRGPAHVDCAKVKTKDDVAQIAKAKRREAKHFGASQPKQTIKTRPSHKVPVSAGRSDAAHRAAMAAKNKPIVPRRGI